MLISDASFTIGHRGILGDVDDLLVVTGPRAVHIATSSHRTEFRRANRPVHPQLPGPPSGSRPRRPPRSPSSWRTGPRRRPVPLSRAGCRPVNSGRTRNRRSCRRYRVPCRSGSPSSFAPSEFLPLEARLLPMVRKTSCARRSLDARVILAVLDHIHHGHGGGRPSVHREVGWVHAELTSRPPFSLKTTRTPLRFSFSTSAGAMSFPPPIPVPLVRHRLSSPEDADQLSPVRLFSVNAKPCLIRALR